MNTQIQYPDRPGHKTEATETSRRAADEMERPAETLRRRCLEVLKVEPLTADEVAGALQCSILSVRPRISELVADNKVVATVARRKNASGKTAVVWAALPMAEQKELEY